MMPTSPLIGGYVDSNNVVRASAFTQELPIADPLVARPLPAGWYAPGLQDSEGHSHQILPKQLQLPEPVYYLILAATGFAACIALVLARRPLAQRLSVAAPETVPELVNA